MRAQFRSLANTGERAQEESNRKMMEQEQRGKEEVGWEHRRSQGRGSY